MKKKLILLVAVLLAAFIPAMALNVQRGVPIGESFLPRRSGALYEKNADYRVALTRGEDETRCEIQLGAQTLSAVLRWQGERARVEYDDGAVIEGVWRADDMWLTDEDGRPVAWNDGATVTINGDIVSIGRGALANALCRMDTNATEPRGSAAVPLGGALLYVVGAAAFLWPEQTYFFGSRWRFNVAELSDDGKLMQKAGGVITMLGSIVLMFYPLFV